MIPRKAILLALLSLPANICAQTSPPQSKATLRSVVRKGSNTTYFDLLRMLLPDLQFDSSDPNSATAHRTIPVKNISDDGEADALEGNFSVTDFGAHWIMSSGRQILLLNLDLKADGANEGTYEGEAALVAAFSVDPTPKVLDVLDVKTDRFTDFWEAQPVFQLNAQHGAFVLHNTHWNAGESYNDLQILFLDGDRFKTITSIFLLNTQGCASTVNETPYFRALPDAGKYPKVIIKVTVKKEADTKECSRKTPAYTRYYQDVFYWNRAKGEYQTHSRQLNALDKFNRNRL